MGRPSLRTEVVTVAQNASLPPQNLNGRLGYDISVRIEIQVRIRRYLMGLTMHVIKNKFPSIKMGNVEMKTGFNFVRVFPSPRKWRIPVSFPISAINSIAFVYPFVCAESNKIHFPMICISELVYCFFSTDNILRVTVGGGMTPQVEMVALRFEGAFWQQQR